MKVSRMCLSLRRYTGAGPLTAMRAVERRPPRQAGLEQAAEARSRACLPRTGLEQAAGECRAGWVNGFRFYRPVAGTQKKQGLLSVDSRLAVMPAKAGIHPFGDAGGRAASGTSGRGIRYSTIHSRVGGNDSQAILNLLSHKIWQLPITSAPFPGFRPSRE